MIAIGDGFARAGTGVVLAASELLNRAGMAISAEPGTTQFRAAAAARLHNDRANVVFCDGHVELIGNHALFLDDSESALRRWNKDNEAHREE
jgi:prepilin-type processing-associated H-X9-DG protein